MSIPSKPLVVIGYDIDELTLGESHVLFGDTYSIDVFRQFLLDHIDHTASWTEAEIDGIKRKELPNIRKQLFETLLELKPVEVSEVDRRPLVTPPRSDDGRG